MSIWVPPCSDAGTSCETHIAMRKPMLAAETRRKNEKIWRALQKVSSPVFSPSNFALRTDVAVSAERSPHSASSRSPDLVCKKFTREDCCLARSSTLRHARLANIVEWRACLTACGAGTLLKRVNRHSCCRNAKATSFSDDVRVLS